MHPDDVTLVNLHAVVLAVAHRIRYRTGLDVLRRFRHALGVLLAGHVVLERDRRGNAHRHVLRGDDVHFLLRQFRRLIRRENDVAVVREHEHTLGVDLIDGVQNVIHRRVHRLTALDHHIHRQITEDAGEAVAQRHCHHAKFLRGFSRGFHRCGRFLRLQRTLARQHVVHLHIHQFAQLNAILDGVAGVVGVHMHLRLGQVARHLDAVADAVQAAAEGIHVALGAVLAEVHDVVLRAVGIRQIAGQIVNILFHLTIARQQCRRVSNFLAAHDRRIAGVNQHEAASAGVDHARRFQGRQHVGRALQNRLAAGQNDIHQPIVVIGIALGVLDGVLRNDARDGQNRALLGLHDRLVRLVRARLQCLRELHGGNLLHALQGRREAAQQLGRDNARVAARALKRTLRDGSRRLVRTQVLLRIDLTGRALHGQGHIRPRIAVRDRENVQRVHRFPVLFEQCRTRDDHVAQQQPVNGFMLYQR